MTTEELLEKLNEIQKRQCETNETVWTGTCSYTIPCLPFPIRTTGA